MLLAQWIGEHPGTRPSAWWRFDAPEARRQLGGRGTLPTARFRNLRVELDHGLPLFDEIDANDPPTFESEAAYLDRLGLLGAGERAQLTASDFSPDTALDD